MSKILINIDAGHGSDTRGKRTPRMPLGIDYNQDKKVDFPKGKEIREHYANVMCAYYYEKYLREYGLQTMRTGWNDTNFMDDPDVALTTRQKQVRAKGALLSVSWHWNACGSGTSFNDVNGIEIFCHDEASKAGDSRRFAEAVMKELVKGTSQKNRGIKEQTLAMCNCSTMRTRAAILIECGFMTNLKEAKLMGSEIFWQECGKEAAEGTVYYLTGGVPQKVAKGGDKETIRWLQMMLNKGASTRLVVDGDYGDKTKNAVVAYWKQVGLNKAGKFTGWSIGTKTIQSLATGTYSK